MLGNTDESLIIRHTYSATQLSGVQLQLWLFPRCGCFLAVVVPSLWLFPRCGCSLAVVVPSLWLFPRCGCSLAVVIPALWLFPRCGCSLAVVVPSSIDLRTQSISDHLVWFNMLPNHFDANFRFTTCSVLFACFQTFTPSYAHTKFK